MRLWPAVVLFDDGGQDAVEPQADNGQQVIMAVAGRRHGGRPAGAGRHIRWIGAG